MLRQMQRAKLYSVGHKVVQNETPNDKCEPQQQYRLGTIGYKYRGKGVGGLNQFCRFLTSPSASAVIHNIKRRFVQTGSGKIL